MRSLRLLENLDQAPALGGAERTGLVDDDEIADAGRVRLVVRLHLGGAADDLAVERLLHAVFDLDDAGLVHLVADDVAAAGLAVPPGVDVADVVLGALVPGRLGGDLRGLLKIGKTAGRRKG